METYSTKVSLSDEEGDLMSFMSFMYVGPRCLIKQENRENVPYNFSLDYLHNGTDASYLDFSLAPDDALKMAFGIIEYYAASKQDTIVDFCRGKVGL